VPARAALREVAVRHLDARLMELTLRTDAVSGPTRVRVLLPAGYRRASPRRFPVLYLLHGALDDQSSWTAKGDAERLTAGLGLIVVMPDSGKTGGYTNWYNNGRGGPPEWERYHVEQLLPFIDRRFRTVGTRAGRAIAGLSMGGFGAMSYAARHPDRFVAAASFSGAVDTNNPLDIAVTDAPVFGPRATQELRWRAHNPWDLAANLRGMTLVVRSGNGARGGPFGGGDVVEAAVHQMSVSFHQRLRRLGVPHVWDDYGPGGHEWPYWQRDLARTLPLFMKAFAAAPRPLARVTFTAAEPRYAVSGWRVVLRRRGLAFTTLRGAGRGGFGLGASSPAVVTTPAAQLLALTRYRVTVRRGAMVTRSDRRTDARGRLAVPLDLGPHARNATVTVRRAVRIA
jgi:S-formylglutathione hydrolase FrmB